MVIALFLFHCLLLSPNLAIKLFLGNFFPSTAVMALGFFSYCLFIHCDFSFCPFAFVMMLMAISLAAM